MLRLTRSGPGAVLALFILMTAGAWTPRAGISAEGPNGVDLLPTDAARMYGFVRSPHPGELQWQQIPWLTDLLDGIRQAEEENRPLLLFVSGDDPLEKC